jgi:hypothetical protein
VAFAGGRAGKRGGKATPAGVKCESIQPYSRIVFQLPCLNFALIVTAASTP